MNKAWWSRGIAFECQPDCGKCCDEPGGVVFLSENDSRRLAKHHSMELKKWIARDCTTSYDGRFILESDPNTKICIYLNENKQCEVYESRPDQCRAFPWWSENMATQRAWKNTVSECPGLQNKEALIIEGNTIRLHIMADRKASIGFKKIPK